MARRKKALRCEYKCEEQATTFWACVCISGKAYFKRDLCAKHSATFASDMEDHRFPFKTPEERDTALVGLSL